MKRDVYCALVLYIELVYNYTEMCVFVPTVILTKVLIICTSISSNNIYFMSALTHITVSMGHNTITVFVSITYPNHPSRNRSITLDLYNVIPPLLLPACQFTNLFVILNPHNKCHTTHQNAPPTAPPPLILNAYYFQSHHRIDRHPMRFAHRI